MFRSSHAIADIHTSGKEHVGQEELGANASGGPRELETLREFLSTAQDERDSLCKQVTTLKQDLHALRSSLQIREIENHELIRHNTVLKAEADERHERQVIRIRINTCV